MRPEALGIFLVDAVAHQDIHCRALGVGNLLGAVRRVVQPPAQGALGLGIQLAQQRGAPGVPQVGVGRVDIGDGQHVQVIQPYLVAHLHGKVMDHLGVGDILALGGGGHQQVIFHQPADQVGIPGGQLVALAELLGINRAELGVIAATALGNVVVQPGDIQQVRFGQTAEDLPGQRVLFLIVGPTQLAQVLDHVKGVGVDCIDVEQVVLHLPDDAAELRQIAPENAVAVHPSQVAVNPFGAAQQLHEQAGVADITAEVIIDQVPVLTQQTDGVGAHPADLPVLGHQQEDLHQREGGALEHLRMGHLDIVVAHLKTRVERQDGRRLGVAQQDLLEVLHQQVVQLGQGHDDAVVLLHEAFDRQLGVVVLEAEQPRQRPLVVEQQPVLGAPGQRVQGEAYLPEKGPAAGEDAVLGFVDKTLLDQLAQVVGAEVAQGHPADGLDIPQAARGALYIGLQVVLGIVELGVAGLLLGALGAEELGTGPHVLLAQRVDHVLAQLRLAHQHPRFHQVGDHGHIRARLVLALADAAHRVADFQADIPQQGEKTADRLVVVLAAAAIAQQDQQVDVRMGVQFAASVAADCQQGDIRLHRAVEGGPGLAQDLVGQPGAVVDQFVNVPLALETGLEYVAGVPQGVLERPGRAARGGQVLAELTRVKQFVIHKAPSTQRKSSSLRRVSIS